MSAPRYNLRTASLYLTKLRNKYKQVKNEQQNNYDNTFIDEQQQLTSDPSINKLSQNKINSNTDRFQQSINDDIHINNYNHVNNDNHVNTHLNNKQKQSSFKKLNKNQKIQQQVNQNISQIKKQQQTNKNHITKSNPLQQQKQQTQFCDLIVIKYLQETLAIYKSDLQILQHNRQNLQQQIYFISKKIGKLHQLSTQNINMQQQILNLNQNLQQLITEYHSSNKKVFKQKLTLDKIFHKSQNKLKSYLLFNNNKLNNFDHYVKPNLLSNGYIDQYNEFLNFKKQQSTQINSKLQNPHQFSNQHNKFIKTLFQGKQNIYFHKEIPKQNATLKSQQIIPIGKNKQKKVVLYDQFQDQDFQEKGKNKQKTKKLTEAQKALLLGDLKNFSKSFKIPK